MWCNLTCHVMQLYYIACTLLHCDLTCHVMQSNMSCDAAILHCMYIATLRVYTWLDCVCTLHIIWLHHIACALLHDVFTLHTRCQSVCWHCRLHGLFTLSTHCCIASLQCLVYIATLPLYTLLHCLFTLPSHCYLTLHVIVHSTLRQKSSLPDLGYICFFLGGLVVPI